MIRPSAGASRHYAAERKPMRFWRAVLAWTLSWIPDGLSRLMLALARSEAHSRAGTATDERPAARPRDGPG